MSNITIYHNPACGTSRNTLEMLHNNGNEPTIINYLDMPPTRDELIKLISDIFSDKIIECIREQCHLMPALSLNVIGHVDIRSIHSYLFNFNEKVSPSHGCIKNG